VVSEKKKQEAVRDVSPNGDVKKVGRPSNYKPEYGDEIISLMERGFSLTASAAKVGFTKHTIYYWMEHYPQFSDAMQKAKGLRQFFLENKLLETKNGAEVNAAKWALACACPDDWRERKEVEVHVTGGMAERLEAAKAALQQLSEDESGR